MKLFLACLVVLSLSVPAYASEEALYAPVPPSDSAFVRTVQVTNEGQGKIQIDGIVPPKSIQDQVSDFIVIKQGSHVVEAGDKKENVQIEAQQYYTIAILGQGEVKVIKDKVIEDPTKASLYFYNFSDANSASLVSPTHKATIFKDISAGGSDSREINAVALGLEVKAGDVSAGMLESVDLKRQQGTSIFLTGKAGSYHVFSVQNKVAQ